MVRSPVREDEIFEDRAGCAGPYVVNIPDEVGLFAELRIGCKPGHLDRAGIGRALVHHEDFHADLLARTRIERRELQRRHDEVHVGDQSRAARSHRDGWRGLPIAWESAEKNREQEEQGHYGAAPDQAERTAEQLPEPADGRRNFGALAFWE